MFGESVGYRPGGSVKPRGKAVLAAMGFIRDDHDIAAVRDGRKGGVIRFGQKFLDCRKDHAAGRAIKMPAQFRAAVGTLGRLAQQRAAHAKGGEQLFVQVVAVCQDDKRGVFHIRVFHDLPGVKGHKQAFPGPLRVPDDPGAAITAAGHGVQGAHDGVLHGVDLVIARQNFDQPAASFPKDGEIPDQLKKAVLREGPVQKGFKFGGSLCGQGARGIRTPGHEAFAISRQGTDAGLNSVRDDKGGIGAKECANLILVGLHLVKGPVKRGVRGAGALQLEHGKGQAIDEQNNIRSAGGPALDDGELADRQPVIGVGVLKINQAHVIAGEPAILCGEFDRHTLYKVPVCLPVFLDQVGMRGLPDAVQGGAADLGREGGVQAVHRCAQPP